MSCSMGRLMASRIPVRRDLPVIINFGCFMPANLAIYFVRSKHFGTFLHFCELFLTLNTILCDCRPLLALFWRRLTGVLCFVLQAARGCPVLCAAVGSRVSCALCCRRLAGVLCFVLQAARGCPVLCAAGGSRVSCALCCRRLQGWRRVTGCRRLQGWRLGPLMFHFVVWARGGG